MIELMRSGISFYAALYVHIIEGSFRFGVRLTARGGVTNIQLGLGVLTVTLGARLVDRGEPPVAEGLPTQQRAA